MGDVVRIDRAKADETVSDADRLVRLAHAVSTFREVPPGAYIAAYATEDGGVNGITYGDIAALVRVDIQLGERLDRIVSWHSRESGQGGLVGDYCNECGHRWPCETRRMAEGTYVDEENDDA